jgi:predicted ATPase
MAAGSANDTIAAECAISRKTVEAIIRSIFVKLDLAESAGMNRRVLAVTWFLEHAPGLDGSARVPVPFTTFVGRVAELADLDKRLDRSRSVTIAGVGGSGKTALALELAHRRIEAGDAVVFADLVGARDRSDVLMSLCDAAGVVASTASSGRRRLTRMFRQDRHVLIFDNAEHVADDVASVIEDLGTQAGPHLLVTSRVPLGAVWEDIWVIPPLSDADASVLCKERVEHAADPDVQAAICRVADGMPLAIELLATQCMTLGAEVVMRRLDDLEILLTRSGTDRHASVTRVLDATFVSLSPEGQRLFCWLGLFPGGFGATQLASLAEPLADRPDVRLGELTGTGLVHRAHDERFRVPEPTRQFALATLTRSDDQMAAEVALIAWAVAFVRERSWGFTEADNRGWRSELRAESPNTDAALEAALRLDDEDTVLRLVGGLSYYWSRHRPVVGRARIRVALPLIRRAAVSRRKGWALLGCSLLDDDPECAGGLRNEAGAVFRQLDDVRGELVAAFLDAENSGSLAKTDTALDLAHTVNEPFFEGWLFVRRAALLHRDGRSADEVLCALREAEAIGRAARNRQLLGGALIGRGGYRLACEHAGDDVATALDEAIALIGESGDPVMFIEALCLRTQLFVLRNAVPRALGAARDATAACQARLSDDVVTGVMPVARAVLLAAIALGRAGDAHSSKMILDAAGDVRAAIEPSIRSGERYPIAPSILEQLARSQDSADLESLTEALRLAVAALARAN